MYITLWSQTVAFFSFHISTKILGSITKKSIRSALSSSSFKNGLQTWAVCESSWWKPSLSNMVSRGHVEQLTSRITLFTLLFLLSSHGVFQDPQSCVDGHTFCIECIDLWLETSNNCPLDNTVIELKLVRNLTVRNIVDNLYVYCVPRDDENGEPKAKRKNLGNGKWDKFAWCLLHYEAFNKSLRLICIEGGAESH